MNPEAAAVDFQMDSRDLFSNFRSPEYSEEVIYRSELKMATFSKYIYPLQTWKIHWKQGLKIIFFLQCGYTII